MALLGQRDPLNDVFGRGAAEGRMGDYVFNQEGQSADVKLRT